MDNIIIGTRLLGHDTSLSGQAGIYTCMIPEDAYIALGHNACILLECMYSARA